MARPAARAHETHPMTATLELPSPGQATYADLEALPERYVGEIIDGTLYAQARPAMPHAQALSALGALLYTAFGRRLGGEGGPPGGWWILSEPELHFGADVLVPDLAGWRRERLPRIPNAPWLELAPDWLCEVASPSTRQFDRRLKLGRYHAAGVGHIWLVEPQARHIEVFRRVEEGWLLVGSHFDDEVAGIEPFQALPLMIGELWLE